MAITYSGLFSGFDLENASALKRLSIALTYYRTSGLFSCAYDISAAIRRQEEEMPRNSLERSNIGEIWHEMNRNTLIREILDEFLTINIEDSDALLAGGVKLRHFVDPLLDNWPVIFKPFTLEQDQIWINLKFEWRKTHPVPNTGEIDVLFARNANLASHAEVAEQLRQHKEKAASSIATSALTKLKIPTVPAQVIQPEEDKEMNDSDESKGESSGSGSPELGSEEDGAWENDEDKTRHTPLKRRGDRILDDGNIDFTPAKVGIVDPSKLHILLITERDCPRTGAIIPGSVVNRQYGYNTKWDSVESVRKLNHWRASCLARDFKSGWKTRPGRWLQSEKDWVLGYLQGHACTKWNRLANAYNKQFDGTMQNAREVFVLIPGRDDETLAVERTAPWRTREAIDYVAKLWPEYQVVVASPALGKAPGGKFSAGKKMSVKGSKLKRVAYAAKTIGDDSSDDDVEILKPSPKPKKVKAPNINKEPAKSPTIKEEFIESLAASKEKEPVVKKIVKIKLVTKTSIPVPANPLNKKRKSGGTVEGNEIEDAAIKGGLNDSKGRKKRRES